METSAADVDLQSKVDERMMDINTADIKCFGFRNFGNTCYLNASLHLLGYVYSMPGARMNSAVGRVLEQHRSSLPRTKVNEILASFVANLQTVKDGNHLKFAAGQQHDAAEFIEYILQNNDNNLLKYHRTCLGCGTESSQTQTAICIQVNAHEDTDGWVFDINYLEPSDVVDMHCQMCSNLSGYEHGIATPSFPHSKNLEFHGQSLQSPFLFFHIQRFLNAYEKDHSPIVNSLEFHLNERRFTVFGFINHVGVSNQHGHYIAYVRKQWNTLENWIMFDDSKVTRLSSFPAAEFRAAYLLLFIEDGYLQLVDDNQVENDSDEGVESDESGSNAEFGGGKSADKGFGVFSEPDRRKGKPTINETSSHSETGNIDHIFPEVQGFNSDFVENKEFGDYVNMETFLELFVYDEENEDIVGIRRTNAVYNGFQEHSNKICGLSVQDGLNYNSSFVKSEYDVDSIMLLVEPSNWPVICGSLSYTLIGKFTSKLLRHNHLYYQHGNQQLRLFRIPHFQLFQINDNISILVFFPNMQLPGTPLSNAVSEVTVEMFMNSCFLPG